MRIRNRRWLLAERPLGRPILHSDFRWDEGDVDAAALEEGEVLVRVLHLSVDPAQKGWMENVADYVAPTALGEVMRAYGIGQVVVSRAAGMGVGDMVLGYLGWQDYAVQPAAELERIDGDGPLLAHLGILGLTGYTAFFGLNRIAKPFPGDTVVITGAAGAVGLVAGQLAKLAGCHVVGIAGGEDKCRWLVEEIGFDAAVDYRAGPIRKQIRPLVPNGIDVLWDNVGGPTFDNLLPLIATHARVVVCGAIAIYSESSLPPGPSHYMNLVFRRARMEGLIVFDYKEEFPWAYKRLAKWLAEGRLKAPEDVVHGLDQAPAALLRLFEGRNRGKQILSLDAQN
ncbi:NADP-dependent oxidoreductase [Flavisphingomonas formosensis]|uniref:NADP-dependent oxidoreductase n=1 Tax=Flavisphingomonas formosensis TaxID=861534 RepID=UPI0012FC059A|nr:NADP-dependent oxidoreductase [Sphingomonas formosensis]